MRRTELHALTLNHVAWLALSGITTTVLWVLYCEAIKPGDVSTAPLIDKGSVVVAVRRRADRNGEEVGLERRARRQPFGTRDSAKNGGYVKATVLFALT